MTRRKEIHTRDDVERIIERMKRDIYDLFRTTAFDGVTIRDDEVLPWSDLQAQVRKVWLLTIRRGTTGGDTAP